MGLWVCLLNALIQPNVEKREKQRERKNPKSIDKSYTRSSDCHTSIADRDVFPFLVGLIIGCPIVIIEIHME